MTDRLPDQFGFGNSHANRGVLPDGRAIMVALIKGGCGAVQRRIRFWRADPGAELGTPATGGLNRQ
ncbi:MAG: hypothetical protein CSA68_03990 [Rhodobacterales bacterium]|nr:MAG: hypothetical protein CSA68_03990 [Rhodobacterales bacterium]